MKKTAWMLSFFFVTVNAAVAVSQPLSVVRSVPGLKCMLLDDAALAATQQRALPPVLSSPDPSAKQLGYTGSIVFVKAPAEEQNGYFRVVRLNGQPGWIDATRLQPWHPMNGGSAKCYPSLMSNGLLGADVH